MGSEGGVEVFQVDGMPGAPFDDGRFHNGIGEEVGKTVSERGPRFPWLQLPLFLWRVLMQHFEPARPVQKMAGLAEAPDNSLWRIGHSTVLIKIKGVFIVTDPVLSSSIVGLLPRHTALPLRLADLPSVVEVVLLSHDHYDHLDYRSICLLKHRTRHFVTPLHVGTRLINWGVPAEKVHQVDWWQGVSIRNGEFRFVCTPATHFSGRTLFDRNKTLWASWSIIVNMRSEAPSAAASAPSVLPGARKLVSKRQLQRNLDEVRIFFSGDGRYEAPRFQRIGQLLGPFDVTLMECGQYSNIEYGNAAFMHMKPEQTVLAHVDVRGQWLVPIHNSTYDLSIHTWHEALERLTIAATQRQSKLAVIMIGERFNIFTPAPTNFPYWWKTAAAAEKDSSSQAAEKLPLICPAYPRSNDSSPSTAA